MGFDQLMMLCMLAACAVVVFVIERHEQPSVERRFVARGASGDNVAPR
jgi:hypothetical protein